MRQFDFIYEALSLINSTRLVLHRTAWRWLMLGSLGPLWVGAEVVHRILALERTRTILVASPDAVLSCPNCTLPKTLRAFFSHDARASQGGP